MITDAQGEALRIVVKAYGGGASFFASAVFPNRDSIDNGHRRALAALQRKGILDRPTDRRCGDYRLTPATWTAYYEWHETRG